MEDEKLSKEEARRKCLWAVQHGNAANVRAMIEEDGADVNTRIEEQNNMTLLHVAVHLGKTEVASTLVDLHADLEARDEEGATPLHAAVARGNVELVSELALLWSSPRAPLRLAGRAPPAVEDGAPVRFAGPLCASPDRISSALASGAEAKKGLHASGSSSAYVDVSVSCSSRGSPLMRRKGTLPRLLHSMSRISRLRE